MTDHVRVVPGPADETAVVRWIFQEFLKGTYEWAIARELNRNGTPTNTGRPWNGPMIGRMLRNECYIGNLIYNRRSGTLREKRSKTPRPYGSGARDVSSQSLLMPSICGPRRSSGSAAYHCPMKRH
jgi:hypothetical protein